MVAEARNGHTGALARLEHGEAAWTNEKEKKKPQENDSEQR
jgi:hypothetical protein